MIRLARLSDAEAMLEIYAPLVRDTCLTFELVPPSVAEFQDRIRSTLEYAPWLVYEESGQVLGYAYAKYFWPRAAYQWSVEVSIYIHSGYHGRGLGRTLYMALFDLLRAQGFCKALAVIALPNPASVSLHESLGFTPVGVFHSVGHKHGSWRDSGWFELTLCDLPASPTPVRSLSRIPKEEWPRSVAVNHRSSALAPSADI